jgi:N,N'-diacetyllegionaminate synthase
VSATVPWEHSLFIVAEAGVNHNGDLALARRLIDAAADAGADAVKFQTWKPGELTGRFAYKVGYLESSTPTGESRYELSRRLALPYEAFRELQAYARERGILFLSTPDGFDSLEFLAGELSLPFIKVASTEVTHPQFLTAVGRWNRPVLLSTGMSDLGEVERALAALRGEGNPSVVLLHCTSEYPAPAAEMNVRAVATLARAFQVPVGLSDHSTGHEAAIAAVALGAVVIEKHFTLDRELPGPDHRASLDPDGLRAFVASLRTVELMLGDGIKRMTPSEHRNVAGIRRSVVARRALKKGFVLTAEDLVCKRPGTGIAPEALQHIVGMRINRDLEEDEPISWDDLR